MDIKLGRALGVRLANLEYVRSWLENLNGINLNRVFGYQRDWFCVSARGSSRGSYSKLIRVGWQFCQWNSCAWPKYSSCANKGQT